MSKIELRCVTALMIAMASAACTEAPVTIERRVRIAADDDERETGATYDDESDEEADDESASTTSAMTKSTKASATEADVASIEPGEEAAPPSIKVTFAASAGQKFGNVPIYRSCSDMGVDFNQASFADATSLSLVNVVDKKVLVKVEGAAFEKLKASVVSGNGELDIPVERGALPATSTEYAIVMGGDGRFGSPAACGASIQPKNESDRGVKGSAGRFPTGRTIAFNRGIGGTGCGIVGFLQAYYDESRSVVYARPTSPLVIAADDEGRAGFPKGYGHKGCDNHDSPLVLDLRGAGVKLGPARADVFDIDGDGRRDTLGWVISEDTPFLVRDANGNGVVDGAEELFGNRTRGRDGLLSSANGFEALAAYDDVEDGVIDAKDRVWSSLRLWFDRDHDGRSTPDELETLGARGVRSIATGYVSVSQRLTSGGEIEGAIRQRGGATMSDGRIVSVLDVWFERHF
ncbi:MAG: hypothetical protein KIT84_08180 [Labilithrix sp.]|nr:hypothetical protein [Labilithrix sp.]MCW5810974.1 hypothetical protein [Labilithrix sp.]